MVAELFPLAPLGDGQLKGILKKRGIAVEAAAHYPTREELQQILYFNVSSDVYDGVEERDAMWLKNAPKSDILEYFRGHGARSCTVVHCRALSCTVGNVSLQKSCTVRFFCI